LIETDFMKRPGFFPNLLLIVGLLASTSAVGAERKVNATISLKQEYSDNLSFTAQNEEADCITTVSPGLELSNKTERLQAGLKLRWDGAMYWENESLNNVDQDFAATLQYAMTERANLFTSAKYLNDSRSDRDITDTGLAFDAVEREKYRFTLGGNHLLSELSRLQLQYNFAEDTYETGQYTDYTSHDMVATLSHDLSSYWANTVGRVNVGYTTYDYDNSDVDNYYFMFGLEHNLSELFSFYVDMGLRYTESQYGSYQAITIGQLIVLDPYEAEAEGFGFMGRAGLSYQGELNDASVVLSHDVQAASGNSGTVERSSLRLELGRRVAERSRLFCAAGYALNKSTTETFYSSYTDEETWYLRAGASYLLTNDLRLVGAYNYAMIHDNYDDEDRDRNLFMLRLDYTYPIIK